MTTDELRQRCKDLLRDTRTPGDWWKAQILEREAQGYPVTISAHELAAGYSREPGSDDE